MTFEQLKQKHIKEWEDFTDAYVKSKVDLHDEKMALLRAYNFLDYRVPTSAKDLIERKHEEWREQWGIGGVREKLLKEKQELETEVFFSRERVMKDLLKAQEKSRTHDNGR